MVDADERPVDPDLLGGDRELDRLAERVAAGVRQPAARVPGAEREEADLLGCHPSHSAVVTSVLHSRGAGEVGMDELDGHRPFPDGGHAAFARARAHVARGEDARQGRLEQVFGACGVAGEDEALVVACDDVAEPFGARQRAEEEKQERERETLAARQSDRLELAVVAVQGGDLAAIANRDAVALELPHEVVRHRLAQIDAAVKQRHKRTATGEPDGGLAG